MSRFLPIFLITAVSVLAIVPFLVFKSNAASLGNGYLFLGRMKVNTATEMTGMFTTSTAFDGAGTKELKIFFPESEGAWCKDATNTVGNLTVTGVATSAIDQGSWSIDSALPGTLVATCYQGGVGENDYISITGITNLLANTSYGFKIDADTNVLRTGSNTGSNLISYQLIEGTKIETTSFSIALLSDDKILVGAYVVETPTITCNIGGNVNLGTLYLGGSYITGNHSLDTSSSGSGFYWTVKGQNAGLSHTSEPSTLSSVGVGGVVDLISGEGFGLVISSSSLGTVQPNYLPSTPGQFGAIDVDPKLILTSDTPGFGDYNVTLGARAGVGATPGPYQEALTYVCGGYIESPAEYSCYIMQASQTQPISTEHQYDYSMPCSTGYDWETVSSFVYKDNVTGLYWSETSPGTLSHADAINYCDTLNLGSRSDWRIPTKDELMQIVPDPCTAISCGGSYGGNNMYGYSTAFTTTNWFWSINEVAEDSTRAWWLGLFDGRVVSELKSASGSARVRCVARD